MQRGRQEGRRRERRKGEERKAEEIFWKARDLMKFHFLLQTNASFSLLPRPDKIRCSFGKKHISVVFPKSLEPGNTFISKSS